jgi:hypothetical protein
MTETPHVTDDISPSNKTRIYCSDHYIIPARSRDQKEVTIRSGDVHRELGFTNRLPLVCAALGSTKFENMARVKRISIDGPTNGANTKFTFQVL